MKLHLHTRGVESTDSVRDLVQRRLRSTLGRDLRNLSKIRVQVTDLASIEPDAVVCTIRATCRHREISVDACRDDATTAITRACLLLKKQMPGRRPTRPVAAAIAIAGA